MSLALADPPANPASPAAATAPSAAQPAASAPATAPAASAATPPAKAQTPTVNVDAEKEQDNLEKHFLSEGYKLEMHHGEKYFCRREEELGSRLGGQKVCGTAQQLSATEREAQSAYQRGQMQQPTGPSGK
jgi:hypothetical protein